MQNSRAENVSTQDSEVFAMSFSQKINAFVKRSPARMAVIISVLLYAITVMIAPASLNIGAITSIMMLTLLLSFASAGQTIVLIGGGLDFSVGAVMSAAAILTVGTMNGQDGTFLQTFIIVMTMGAIVGILNGICTTKIKLPALIVTMVVSNVLTRVTYVYTAGSPPGFASPSFIQSVIGRYFNVIPSLTLYAVIIFGLMFYILNRSRFGRQLYLVGNNIEAARLCGIKVNRVKFLSYLFSALFAAFAGMLGAGYMQFAQCQMFDGYAFSSLIAVIVGGTTFAGGVGSYTGSIAGSLLMVVLSNMLSAMNLPQPVRNIVMCCILIALLTMYNRKKAVRQ